jgi:hypothetical protein
VPTLVATGDHDPNLVSSRRALSGFVDARLEVLPHTGHGSVMHRPDLVADLAVAFLAGLKPNRRRLAVSGTSIRIGLRRARPGSTGSWGAPRTA